MAPAYRDILLNSLLTGSRDADHYVRASSVSSLAELCQLLHFSLGTSLHEVRSLTGSCLLTGSRLLAGSRDAYHDVRASSVSSLAELCQLLHFSLGPCLHEVSSLTGSCLLTGSRLFTGSRDADHYVRASSVSSLAELCQLLHFSLGTSLHEVRSLTGSCLLTGSRLLAGSRDAYHDVRASSVSSLAELCQLLHFSLGPCLHEVRWEAKWVRGHKIILYAFYYSKAFQFQLSIL